MMHSDECSLKILTQIKRLSLTFFWYVCLYIFELSHFPVGCWFRNFRYRLICVTNGHRGARILVHSSRPHWPALLLRVNSCQSPDSKSTGYLTDLHSVRGPLEPRPPTSGGSREGWVQPSPFQALHNFSYYSIRIPAVCSQ